MKYVAPEFQKSSYNCPYCDAYAKMEWDRLHYYRRNYRFETPMWVSLCSHCQQINYWIEQTHPEDSKNDEAVTGQMVLPNTTQAPLPHVDMPESVRVIYEEAREIVGASPRAAAALLRLSVQQLCVELGETGKTINDNIANLVKKGLPSEIQKALDIVRVVGNNAVHPGELQPNDISSIALSLFELVNQIVEERIAKPNKLQEIFNRLPKGDRNAIKNRDK